MVGYTVSVFACLICRVHNVNSNSSNNSSSKKLWTRPTPTSSNSRTSINLICYPNLTCQAAVPLVCMPLFCDQYASDQLQCLRCPCSCCCCRCCCCWCCWCCYCCSCCCCCCCCGCSNLSVTNKILTKWYQWYGMVGEGKCHKK